MQWDSFECSLVLDNGHVSKWKPETRQVLLGGPTLGALKESKLSPMSPLRIMYYAAFKNSTLDSRETRKTDDPLSGDKQTPGRGSPL